MVLAAVAFDLDGTLFDHQAAARQGLRAWATDLGATWDEELATAWTTAEARHFTAWRDGHISFAEQRRRRLRDVLPLIGHPVGDDEELDAVFEGYLAAYQRAWCGYPDVNPALEQLQQAGLATAVLTNGNTAQQKDKLAHIGLLGRVGPVLTSEALGVAKPAPGAFHALCDHLSLPGRVTPQQVLYVGDDHAVDVVGAATAGLHVVHLDRVSAGTPSGASRIETLADLAAVAEAL
ncbi:HAD family hydrolase [Pseudokineococcus basanitobsidens]|uniref:HAD family hydrolase n=1 Tax=Pseudokineococcus basanitobsidens TaxID=1926649 RepID=A0ABU8RNC8_9ACTN